MRWVNAVLCAVLFLGWAAIGYAEDRSLSRQEVADIVSRLSASQAKAVTVDYRWVNKVLEAKGDKLLTKEYPEEARGPAQDTTFEESVRIVIDGDRLRVDKKGMIWSVPHESYVPSEWTWCVTDGIAKICNPLRKNATVESGSDSMRYLTDNNIMPIICAYRLFDKSCGLARPDEVQFAGYSEEGGHACVVIEKTQHKSVYRWSLAKDLGYRPVRVEASSKGWGTILVVTMQYVQDAAVEWRLASWTTSNRIVGTYGTTDRVETRLNDLIPPDTFRLSFPVGTEVIDDVAGTTYTVDEEPKAEESSPVVSEKTVGTTAAEIRTEEQRNGFHTENGGKGKSSGRSYGLYVLVGCLLAGMAVIALLVLRKRNTLRSS